MTYHLLDSSIEIHKVLLAPIDRVAREVVVGALVHLEEGMVHREVVTDLREAAITVPEVALEAKLLLLAGEADEVEDMAGLRLQVR